MPTLAQDMQVASRLAMATVILQEAKPLEHLALGVEEWVGREMEDQVRREIECLPLLHVLEPGSTLEM